MPLLLPLVLCVIGAVIAMLPPADVQPHEGPSRWGRTAVAVLAVAAVLAVTLHAHHSTDPHTTRQLAGNP